MNERYESQCEEWKKSISATRAAIRDGSLRELVEKQCLSSPKSVERLRIHDKKISNQQGKKSGLSRILGNKARLRCNSFTSRSDPLIQDWHKRISLSYPSFSSNDGTSLIALFSN